MKPFLMSIYLPDLIRNLPLPQFFHVLVRTALISAIAIEMVLQGLDVWLALILHAKVV